MQAELITCLIASQSSCCPYGTTYTSNRPRSALLTTTTTTTPDSPFPPYNAHIAPHANTTRCRHHTHPRIHIDNHAHTYTPSTSFRLNNPRTISAVLLTQNRPPAHPHRLHRPRIILNALGESSFQPNLATCVSPRIAPPPPTRPRLPLITRSELQAT